MPSLRVAHIIHISTNYLSRYQENREIGILLPGNTEFSFSVKVSIYLRLRKMQSLLREKKKKNIDNL